MRWESQDTLKEFIKKWINKLANVNQIKFGEAFKTGRSLDDNIKTLVAIGTLV